MRKLGRKKADRNHLIRNLATSLVLFEYIETTRAKAKEVKGFLDSILAKSKANDFNTIRFLNTELFDKNAVKKVVEELVPRYKNRNSGFIRSFLLKNRLGDDAPMMRLELVDKKVFVNENTDKVPAIVKEKTTKEKAAEKEVTTKVRTKKNDK